MVSKGLSKVFCLLKWHPPWKRWCCKYWWYRCFGLNWQYEMKFDRDRERDRDRKKNWNGGMGKCLNNWAKELANLMTWVGKNCQNSENGRQPATKMYTVNDATCQWQVDKKDQFKNQKCFFRVIFSRWSEFKMVFVRCCFVLLFLRHESLCNLRKTCFRLSDFGKQMILCYKYVNMEWIRTRGFFACNLFPPSFAFNEYFFFEKSNMKNENIIHC